MMEPVFRGMGGVIRSKKKSQLIIPANFPPSKTLIMKILLPILSILTVQTIAAQDLIDFSKAPGEPTVFAAGVISSGLSERDLAISPDGKEIFYTIQLPQGLYQTLVCRRKDSKGKWGQPEVPSFAGHYSDLEPAFSADGKRLYFSSNRPLSGTAIKDFDIWVVERVNGQWGEPRNLGAPVNTSEDEFYPSLARNGNLYFTAAYKEGTGKEDIYFAKPLNGGFSSPTLLDTAINSKTYEFNAFVSPDEDYIIFTSYGRKDDKGRGDLYMSRKDASGNWQPAVNLAILNSEKLDYCPSVSPDGTLLFFTSERLAIPKSYPDQPLSFSQLKNKMNSPQNGNSDIYWIRTAALPAFFGK